MLERISLSAMREAANELNNVLGLEPPIDHQLFKPELADKLREAGRLIDLESDPLSQETLGVLEDLGIPREGNL
ncbi:MAG: hypothetical protein V5A14_04635 [Desulfohalobiaceae bacterium]